MKKIWVLLLVLMTLVVATFPVAAAKPTFGELYHDGEVVRTVIPPAAFPNQGVDDLYVVMGGAQGQLGIAAVAPGEPDYHGGRWAFHSVTWNVEPYLLTSEAAVLAAETAGDVTITRVPANDFLCPIQP